MEYFRQTIADIDLDNLAHNWSVIRNLAGNERFICPMVKANAYGHGAVEVVATLEREGAKSFGICLIEEGLTLRESGCQSEILVFGGFDQLGAEKILEYQMTPVVSSWEQIRALESFADSPVKVHLKFDTGMNRLGFAAEETEALVKYFKTSKSLKLKAVISHLSNSEDSLRADGVTTKQLSILNEILSHFKSLNVFNHILSSGGISGFSECSEDSILKKNNWGFRPGLMLYGYQVASHFKNLDLKPVMSFKSIVSQQRKLNVGESVSYGSKWTASRPSQVAVVPMGYADGVSRQLSNKGSALIGGVNVPILGIVCMDFIILDVTDLCAQQNRDNWVGEEVVLFGQDSQNNFLSADAVARMTNTISWEVLTSVSSRVPRHFKGLKNHE